MILHLVLTYRWFDEIRAGRKTVEYRAMGGKETCDRCFDRFAVCKDCSEGKTEEEVKAISGMEWDEDDPDGNYA